MSGVFPCHFGIAQNERVVAQFVAGIGCPVGSNGAFLVVHSREERLVGTLDIELVEAESLLIVLLTHEERGSATQVFAVGVEIVGIELPVLGLRLFRFGNVRIDGVEPLTSCEESVENGKDIGCINLLPEIHLLVLLFVLFAESVAERQMDFQILLVDTVFQQVAHERLCLVKVFATLYNSPCLSYLFLLSVQARH